MLKEVKVDRRAANGGFRLGSGPLVHAPGLFRYLKAMSQDNNDLSCEILSETWSLPKKVAYEVLVEDTWHVRIDGDVVVLSPPKTSLPRKMVEDNSPE